MNNNKLNIKLIRTKPHKIYKADIVFDAQIKELCRFLRNQKDKQIEVIINGKSTKFRSVAGMKRFASGFESAFNIIEARLTEFYNKAKRTETELTNKLSYYNKECARLKNEAIMVSKKHIVFNEAMNIRVAAWEDRVKELEGNRKMLMAQIARLQYPILNSQ